MFDRSLVMVGGSTSHHTTHIEQQPHDAADAARLHGEIKRQAEAEITASIARKVAVIDAQFVEVFRLPHEGPDLTQIIYRINGRTFSHKLERRLEWQGPVDSLRLIANDLATAILIQLEGRLNTWPRTVKS